MMTAAIRSAIFAHAREKAALSPPEEAVGVIAKGQYHPLINRAEDRWRSFAVSPDDLAKHRRLDALVHSHPGGPYFPSETDMRQQLAMAIPWWIAVVATADQPLLVEDLFQWGGLPPPDANLKYRHGYRHGVHDCYSLIRHYYHHQFGLTLEDIPRAWDWWHDGGDLYAEGFARQGFVALPEGAALQEGDVFLARLRAKVINHAGLWLGDGLIFHHLGSRDGYQPERLPQKEPAERWFKFIHLWIRHQSKM